MNALPRTAPAPTTPNRPVGTSFAPVVDRNRVRDFGVGYGNSSGYATARRYTSNWATPRFRCA